MSLHSATTGNAVLDEWNSADRQTAFNAILPCNGSRAWASKVASKAPLETPDQLFTTADEIWWSLAKSEWQEAFDSHPRIGESKAKSATAKSESWSAGEQASASPDAATLTELAEGNRAYEEKFGRIFIVCATGKTAAEMLAILEQRLANDTETEWREAAEQQRQITQLRLRKWLGIPVDQSSSKTGGA